MITDRDTNTVYFSGILKDDPKYSRAASSIQDALELLDIHPIYLPKTQDIWARDYMPIQTSDLKFVEFRYDPDYLQGDWSGRRNYKTYPDIVCVAIGKNTIKSELIIDGGNVVKSADCIILTDKIVTENRFSVNKTKLLKKLEETFEVNKVILIPWDKLDDYGHSDGVLRFINSDTLLISQNYLKDSLLHNQLKKAGFKLEYLNFTTRWTHKYNWAYINFLQTKDLILLPRLGADEDEQALNQISDFYSDYAERNRIIQVDMNEIIALGGALNCISWTTKE